MAELWPVFVTSKGRAATARTPSLLELSGAPHRICVEPAEVDAYAEHYPRRRLLEIGDSARGLVYVRNWVLARARAEGLGWFWMLDDDIDSFYRVEGRKCVKAPAAAVLLAAQDIIGTAMAAHGALEYQQFAWRQEKVAALNSYCDVAVAIHAGRTRGIGFREGPDLKTDRDFTLQVMASGWDVVRAARLAFSCPKNGSNKGGLAEDYAQAGREERASRWMESAWGPEVCRFSPKPDGRPDVKINWRYFKAPSQESAP